MTASVVWKGFGFQKHTQLTCLLAALYTDHAWSPVCSYKGDSIILSTTEVSVVVADMSEAPGNQQGTAAIELNDDWKTAIAKVCFDRGSSTCQRLLVQQKAGAHNNICSQRPHQQLAL